MDPIRVLVTGAGSGVGQGILKALRISSLPLHVISADISPLNSALFRADEAVLLPKVESENSLEEILRALKACRAQVVMIGSEFDLEFFSQNRELIRKETGAMVIASPYSTIEIAQDKWLTAEFLRKNGLAYAKSALPQSSKEAKKNADEWGYPLVLKTRTGTSSRHVHVVKDAASLEALFSTVPNPMLQQMIANPSHALQSEYTCSVFRGEQGEILGPFTARRTLRGGSSWVVEVDHFRELYPLLLGIAEKLPSMGSLNVQLMVGKDGPVPFEFNTRFSGTTAVRAHFGFNEPDMAIRSYFLHEKLSQPEIGKGLALRYLEEVFVDGASAETLSQPPFPSGIVRPWF